jgi:hypothetical protein
MSLDIFNVVELRSEWVIDVNDENFPVCLAFVKESHDSENLDLLDLAGVAYGLTDLADVERVIVALCLGFRVSMSWVFPGLRLTASPLACVKTFRKVRKASAHLRESTVCWRQRDKKRVSPDKPQYAQGVKTNSSRYIHDEGSSF